MTEIGTGPMVNALVDKRIVIHWTDGTTSTYTASGENTLGMQIQEQGVTGFIAFEAAVTLNWRHIKQIVITDESLHHEERER